jgi:hypothetical protein
MMGGGLVQHTVLCGCRDMGVSAVVWVFLFVHLVGAGAGGGCGALPAPGHQLRGAYGGGGGGVWRGAV